MAAHEDLDERLLHRLLFFTDAVFAIVMTLLVLDLKPPIHSSDGLASLGPSVAAFLLSFIILAIFWLAHLTTTRRLQQFDWPTAVANLGFLLPVCLIPFVSAWVGETMMNSRAWGVYCVTLMACSATNALLVFVQSRGRGRLMAGAYSTQERIYRLGRALSPGLAFTVGLAGVGLGYATAPQLCWLLIPVFLTLCRLFLAPKAA